MRGKACGPESRRSAQSFTFERSKGSLHPLRIYNSQKYDLSPRCWHHDHQQCTFPIIPSSTGPRRCYSLFLEGMVWVHTLHLPDTHTQSEPSNLRSFCGCFVAQPDLNSIRRTNEKAMPYVEPQATCSTQFLIEIRCPVLQTCTESRTSCCKVNTFSLLSVSVTLLLVWAT